MIMTVVHFKKTKTKNAAMKIVCFKYRSEKNKHYSARAYLT